MGYRNKYRPSYCFKASNNEEHEKVEEYKVSLFVNLHSILLLCENLVIKDIVSVVEGLNIQFCMPLSSCD